MHQFCVSLDADENRSHIVHLDGCPGWPALKFTRLLGLYEYCGEALRAARMFFGQVDGCSQCTPQCHAQFQISELVSQAEP
jgi:hypothetical protein